VLDVSMAVLVGRPIRGVLVTQGYRSKGPDRGQQADVRSPELVRVAAHGDPLSVSTTRER
jgi:hypothetical protein